MDYSVTLSTSLHMDGTEEISSSRIQESVDQGRCAVAPERSFQRAFLEIARVEQQ